MSDFRLQGLAKVLVHCDMVCDLRLGSEILIDDQLFCKDGKFVL
jgi:hypothetical protein